MAVTRLEVTRREPVLGGAPFGAGGPYEKIEGVLHFAVDPAARVHEPIADLGLAPAQRARARRVLGRLLPPAPAGRRESPPAAGRPQPRAQDRARHVQQRAALERPVDPRGLRQRLPDAPRLRGGVDRLAARRAAPRRHDGAHGTAGARRVRARALRVPAERARRRAAARRPLPHPAPGGAPRRSGGGAARARARGGARGHGAARRVALPRRGLGRARRRLRARADLRVLLPGREPAGGRARLHRGARHRGLPALGDRGGGESVRGTDRPVLRVRGLAERPLPAPPALPRARRGRGGPPRVGRGDPARGGRAARRVQLPLRPALAERGPRGGQPVPVHRRGAGRPDHRAARGPAPPARRRARGPRASSRSTPRPSTGAATARSCTPTWRPPAT